VNLSMGSGVASASPVHGMTWWSTRLLEGVPMMEPASHRDTTVARGAVEVPTSCIKP
jgi:hypothetical protein